MTKTEYDIIGADGLVKNWFVSPFGIIDNAGVTQQVKEGHYSFLPTSGTKVFNLRFDSIPFGGVVSGGNMTFRYGISDKTLTVSPKFVCLGSSTMFGHGLSSPNRLADRLTAWLTANTTGSSLTNLAVEGYTMANLRTVANGGTVNQNIEAACALNPSIIFVDEPTNWANVYDEATQISYMMELFNYGFARGALVIFTGSRPRTPYSGTQDTRLANLNVLLAAHRTLKYVCCLNYANFLKAATVADLRTDYDQGDGIHLNAAGVIDLANTITAFWVRVFFSVTAFNQYIIEKSTDSGSTWATFQTLTDMTANTATYTAATGQYRIKARLKDNVTYTDTSAVAALTSGVTPVLRQFNFNATAQSTANWIDVSGNPFVADVTSAVYPGTTTYILCRTLNASSVNIWGNNGGTSSNNSIGAVPSPVDSGIFPNSVIVSGMFTTGQSYAAGSEQIVIKGLVAGTAYNIKCLGSRVASAVSTATRLMDFNLVDAVGLTTVSNYDVKGNSTTLATFNSKVADSSGNIYLGINRPIPVDANFNFAYIMGMTIIEA